MTGNGDDRDDRAWADRLSVLPREVEPARDPWPRIAAQISAQASAAQSRRPVAAQRTWWPLAGAAAIVLALGVALVVRAPSETVAPPAIAPAPLAPAYAEEMQVTELEYLAALREVEALAREGVPPWLRAADGVDLGWQVMRAVEDELIAALRRNPDDAYVSQRLVALRARQVDMLRLVASAELASRRQMI